MECGKMGLKVEVGYAQHLCNTMIPSPHPIDVPLLVESLDPIAQLGHHSAGYLLGVIVGVVVVDKDFEVAPRLSVEADVLHVHPSFTSPVVHVEFDVAIAALQLPVGYHLVGVVVHHVDVKVSSGFPFQ